MSRRAFVVAGAALAVTAAVAVPAVAAKGGGATLHAVDGQKVVINKMAADTSHYSPGTVSIASGATLKITDKGGVPHTFSLVKKSQLPTNGAEVNDCLGKGVCGQIAQAHQADPNSSAPPKKLFVDVGRKNFDQAGDSIFFAKTTRVKITAKKGTTLYFMCAIHPWMQGKVVVR